MKVYQAIATVMAKMASEGISKGRSNQQQGYKFRGIDDIYNSLARVLSDSGLVIIPRVLSRVSNERTTAKGGVLFYVVCDMEFDFVATEDGSKHTARMMGEAMDGADKATNKAMSAAYKYVCLQTFCIPTEGDNDADATTHDLKPNSIDQIEYVTKSQAASIRQKLVMVDLDEKTFLNGMAESIDLLPASQYEPAINYIQSLPVTGAR